MEAISWHRTRTDVGGSPFKAVGDDWCNFCKMGVDAQQEAYCRGQEFVFRKRCGRCGRLIAWGAYKIGMLEGRAPAEDAYLWINERGGDRT